MAFKQYNEAPVIENLTGEEKVYINDGNSFKQASIKDIVAQGSKKNDYLTIKKIKDYLFETHYGVIDYGNAYAYFASQADPIDMGACSAARNGNWYGRNLDWTYDENAEFIVHTPHIAGRYASIAVAGGIPGLTNDVVISEEYNALYKIVPFRLYDGINEHGVIINMNVVPTDNGTNVSIPTEQEEVTISAQMLVRYVLDYFKTASEAVDYIQKHMKIYFSNSLHDHNYELHFMVADEEKTYLVEFAENAAIVVDMSDDADSNIAGKAYMTNFYLNDITLNDDGTVYTPGTQTADYNAKDTNGITDCGAGLERYNYIVDTYDSANTKDGMRAMMNGLKYTRTYSTAPDAAEPVWLTEYVGVLGLTVISDPEDFDAVVQYAGGLFNDRTRTDGLTWQTVHSAVYDIENRALNIIVQEDGEELEFALDGFERKDNPEPVVLPPEVENAIETHGMGWTDTEENAGFDIQWDGNTEGLEVTTIDNVSFYKISDDLTTIRNANSLIGSSVVVELDPPETFVLSENDVTTDDGKVYTVGEGGMLVVAFEDGVIGIGVEFSKGIWFPSFEENEGHSYISRLYKEASTEEVVHQIDQKYIPQGPEVTNAIETGGMGWTKGESITIEWDGSDEGHVIAEEVAASNGIKIVEFVKVSDDIPTQEELVNALYVTSINPDNIDIKNNIIVDQDSGSLFVVDTQDIQNPCIVVVPYDETIVMNTYLFPEAGIYFIKQTIRTTDEPSIIYVASITYGEIVYQIDPKYIPQSSGGGGMVVTFTSDDDGNLISDKTVSEVKDALDSTNVSCVVRYPGSDIFLTWQTLLDDNRFILAFGLYQKLPDQNAYFFIPMIKEEDGEWVMNTP